MKSAAAWALLLASIAVAGNTYDLEVSFDPEAKVIQGKMTVSFVNDGSDPIDQVPFRLDLNRTGKDEGWMSVQEVTGADGSDQESVPTRQTPGGVRKAAQDVAGEQDQTPAALRWNVTWLVFRTCPER